MIRFLRQTLLSLITLIFVAAAGFGNMPIAHAETNLITNPSVEIADGTKPQSWSSSAWGGTSANFSYLNEGRTGSHSVKTEVTDQATGDAKWYFEPVIVEPGTKYQFSNYYKANVETQVVAQYTDASGNDTYQWLGSLEASAGWSQADFSFTTPANAKKTTIFHIVDQVGWLTVDDFSLVASNSTPTTPEDPEEPTTPPATPPPSGGGLIPNSSVETPAGTKPQSWTNNKWGTNNATFEYLNEGHTGNRSVKVTVSNYQSGDAKWYFEPVSVSPSTDYTFTTFYKSNAATHVVAVYYDAANNPTYVDLANDLDTSDTWQEASFPLKTLASTKKVSIFHVVENNGWLILDDVSLQTSGGSSPSDPPSGGDSLIKNASVETANGSKPANWTSNKWGTNTANFTYPTGQAHTGSRSVKAEMTSYTDGDAKWYFEPISVEGNKTYTFSDYYKSNITSTPIVRYTDQNGNFTYDELGTVNASTQWSKFSAGLTTPAGTKEVTVFHIINKVGWLEIDDVDITYEPATPPPSGGGLIPNSSVETPAGTKPQSWTNNKWGTNNATFEYLNEGHTGNRSVKVTVSNYQSGDAKWYFEPITTLQPGSQYRFSTWYKTNTVPHAVAMFLKADGSEQYFGMPDPQPNGSSDWQLYSDTFNVPIDAVQVSVFLFVSGNGYVQTDDYSIGPYQPVGFNRPLLTLTFDDGHEDNVTNALPLLNQYNLKTTQCYATEFVEGQPDQVRNVLMFVRSGHEICSHTVTHPFLTQVTDSQRIYELQHSKEYLESIVGKPVLNFASPYGDYNEFVNSEIMQYYRSHRTVDEGYNTKDNFNIYRLRVQNMQSTTTIAEVQSWINKAKADNSWLILVYHRVSNKDIGQFDTYTNDFAQQLQAIANSGITVRTYNDALNELTSQL